MDANRNNQDEALRTLNALDDGVNYVEATGDVEALKVLLRDASRGLEILRSHHLSTGMPVDERIVAGNGHSH